MKTVTCIPYDVARERSMIRAVKLWREMDQIPGAEYPGLGEAVRLWRAAAILRELDA